LPRRLPLRLHLLAMCCRATDISLLVLTIFGLTGCFARHSNFKFNNETAPHYHHVATQIEYPDAAAPRASNECTAPPLVLSTEREPTYWELRLEESMHLALENSRVLRDLGGLLLRSPETAPTVHGPAIQETDPRFGVEAALSEFDAVFSAQAVGGKNDRPLNNAGGPNSPEDFTQDVTLVEGEIQKRAATGSLFSLRHIIDYDANLIPTNRFPTIWNTNVEGEFRQPLLQGAGVQYNRIAGLNGVPGLANGVLVARVNTDISLSDFEIGVRDLVSNVENAYWDLYFAYRDLDAKIAARNAARESWQRVNALYVAGRRGGEAEREAEAREQYFRFEEEVQNALTGRLIEGTQTNNGSSGGSFRGTGGVHVAERRLRLLLGLPINDGRLIRPAEEPPLAKVVFDWQDVTSEALVRRAELRRQKWVIKRRELELVAARNYLLPQLDAVGLYRWRGLGDTLIAPSGAELDRFDDAYDNLLNGYYQEWQVGMEFSMPFGFRRGHAAVRNAQLQLARERAILDEQEREVLLGLSNAIAEVERAWGVAQTNYNRRLAARQQFAAVQAAFESDKADLDLVLEAQRRMSEADTRYFATLAEYALAIKNVHFEKGSLLDLNEVYLAEGPWPGKAYDDAAKRSHQSRPVWPLNYIFKKGPVISTGPMPQQTIPIVSPAPEAIPLPPPDGPSPPASVRERQMSQGEASNSQTAAGGNVSSVSVTVSDTATDGERLGLKPESASQVSTDHSPAAVRATVRSALWPPRWK
jgi:outer membrane protein TolC